jgi:glycosyltransferase involved in cell wall biosynthesis
MNLLKQANESFKKKKYENAYKLYLEASQKYGEGIVKYSLLQCEKNLDKSKLIELKQKYKSYDINRKNLQNIKGAFNTIRNESNFIKGWLISFTENDARKVQLVFDKSHVIETEANIYRSDLVSIGLTNLNHGFSIQIPNQYYDNKEHTIELIDSHSGFKVASKKFKLKRQINFYDFDDMQIYNFLNPIVNRPFSEEKKRAFAFCDVLAKHMEKKALKESNIKVSVLMPVFNRETIVKHAIKSVLNQTYQNFEFIIIDDGSSDKSVEQISSITDPRITLIKQEKNQGKSAALNTGLKIANGDWIAYIDSDNTWHKRYLASMIGSIQSENSIDAIYSGQLLFKGNSKEPYAIRFCPFNKNLLLNRNYIDHNSFMHHKDILKRVGYYDKTLKRTLDYEFILRVVKQGVVVSAPLLLTNYYYDAVNNSITNNHTLNSDVKKVRLKAQEMLLDKQWTKKIKYRHEVLKANITPMSVIIPSYESLDNLKKCINSLLSLDEHNKIEIIVVDNSSSKVVVDYLTTYQKKGLIKLILNKHNYGFTYAVNQGMELAQKTNDIVLLNNDAEVLNGSLELLSKFSSYLPDAGLLVPAQILPPDTDTINTHVPFANKQQYSDVNISTHHQNLNKLNIFEDGSHFSIDFAPFFCVYIPRTTLDNLGFLDSELGRHYRSDRLYCNSVRKILNKKIYYIPDSRVLHSLQKSTKDLKNTDEATFDIMFKKNWWSESLLKKLSFERRSWDV